MIISEYDDMYKKGVKSAESSILEDISYIDTVAHLHM